MHKSHHTLNEIILNVSRNYVPKYITVDDKDPVWMNEKKLSEQNIQNGNLKVNLSFLKPL